LRTVELNAPSDPATFRQSLYRTPGVGHAHLCIGSLARYGDILLTMGVTAASPLPNFRRLTFIVERNLEAAATLLSVADLRPLLGSDGSIHAARERTAYEPGCNFAQIA
jgi:hypothetical protein